MLKHKCPKCGNELGYKWNTSLYRRGYQCKKCKTKLETTFYLTMAMFLSFFIGLTLTDNIAPSLGIYQSHPQITRAVTTFLCIILVWMVVSVMMPKQLRVTRTYKKLV